MEDLRKIMNVRLVDNVLFYRRYLTKTLLHTKNYSVLKLSKTMYLVFQIQTNY